MGCFEKHLDTSPEAAPIWAAQGTIECVWAVEGFRNLILEIWPVDKWVETSGEGATLTLIEKEEMKGMEKRCKILNTKGNEYGRGTSGF